MIDTDVIPRIALTGDLTPLILYELLLLFRGKKSPSKNCTILWFLYYQLLKLARQIPYHGEFNN